MKKVLIITYYWPPAGGPGVQRWLKFVKYLKGFDVEPVVYIPENPHYPLIDHSLLDQIPKGIKIMKLPIKEPYGFAKLFVKQKTQTISSGIIPKNKPSPIEKLMLFVRGNFFIPDARVGWVKPSVEFLNDYLIENPVDVIITTGPPHSLHLIGKELKKQTQTTWIADFRDPWTTIGYHKELRLTRASQQKHKQLEKEVLQTADYILVTSPTTKKEFEAITQKPIEVITNGFDVEISTETEFDEKFTLAHIGSLLSERNPVMLWKVLSDLVNENEAFKMDFELKLAGVVSDDVLKSISNYQLSKHLNNLGYVSHKQSIELQIKSQVLLLIEIDSHETKAIIPGKLFEYLAAKRPIVAIGPEGSDIEEIINRTEAGMYFDFFRESELKAHILSLYQKFKVGKLEVTSKNIEQYSRKNLTKKLVEIINSTGS
jgi:glycosyltransferase involved in cell wall biosynthesis